MFARAADAAAFQKAGDRMSINLSRSADDLSKTVRDFGAFGTTVVEAGHRLAGYVGRVLGTTPEDAAGLVFGDPLRFVRTEIASQYDDLLTSLLGERGVDDPQPVAPALAIPLLRAAYDENRPELQEFWARLLAAAVDPTRAPLVRQSFIVAVAQLDPLDARVAGVDDQFQRARHRQSGRSRGQGPQRESGGNPNLSRQPDEGRLHKPRRQARPTPRSRAVPVACC